MANKQKFRKEEVEVHEIKKDRTEFFVLHQIPFDCGHQEGRFPLYVTLVTILDPHYSFRLCSRLLGGVKSMKVAVL
jgi:hypothetical protein